MNPHLIERLAHERHCDRLRRADIDRRLHAAGRPSVRLPKLDLSAFVPHPLRRRRDACATSSAPCA